MILTPDDRSRLFDAFVERIGPTALPATSTIDDLCRNLVLAIPALLETCEELDGHCPECHAAEEKVKREDVANCQAVAREHIEEAVRLRELLAEAQRTIATLTARLEADPCP